MSPAHTLAFTFMLGSFAHLVLCPSHRELASPMLAAYGDLRGVGRLARRALSDLNGVRGNHYTQAKHLLKLVHKIGKSRDVA